MSNRGEESTFYCQIDTHVATKDYGAGGRCVRLIGIQPKSLRELENEAGVQTFTIDIDFWEYAVRKLKLDHWRQVRSSECAELHALDDNAEEMQGWLKLKVQWSTKGSSYIYSTFSGERPRYFNIEALGRFLGAAPLIPQRATPHRVSLETRSSLVTNDWVLDTSMHSQSSSAAFQFETFHVGQGMCSLVHNQDIGVLLDVGAGKPITRNVYRSGAIQNDMIASTKGLNSLTLAVSHADSDHWRILAWDKSLRDKIEKIYVPLGLTSLPFKDAAIIDKLVPTSNRIIVLSDTARLVLLLSSPKFFDSNGNCLVAVFNGHGKLVLAAGDYVYDRFADDGNLYIRQLHQERFSGVVVPHHGDLASANAVVRAASDATAFFSAGTHQGYNHPRSESIHAHDAMSFLTRHDKTQKNIVRVILL